MKTPRPSRNATAAAPIRSPSALGPARFRHRRMWAPFRRLASNPGSFGHLEVRDAGIPFLLQNPRCDPYKTFCKALFCKDHLGVYSLFVVYIDSFVDMSGAIKSSNCMNPEVGLPETSPPKKCSFINRFVVLP